MNNRLELAQIAVGSAIVEWQIEAIFGDEIPKTSDFNGKPLLILFFSLGCPGCLGRAIPFANKLVLDLEDQINIIGIHTNFEGVDFPQERFEQAKQDFHIRFPFYKDYNYDTTFLNYGAGGTPHWILVDQEGIVNYSIFGSEPNSAFLRLDYVINELIRK